MESSFTQIIKGLNLLEIFGLGLACCLLIYFVIIRQPHYLMFSLALSAALVGSTIPILGNIAPVVRWLAIFLFVALGILNGKLKVPNGFLLFWGYAILGFISLFRALSFGYQIQRSVLLLIVAFMIPLVYTNKTFLFTRRSLEAIALASSVFCILNFILLPGGLSNVGRFSGLSKGAASFALFLGGMLPFTLWGTWKTRGWMRFLCLCGFLTGFVTLVFTGQRTGTLAGVISLIPLFLLMQTRKTFGYSLLLVIGVLSIGFFFSQQSDVARNTFLLSRYSTIAGLSGRETIWQMALEEIAANPVLGRGIGAAEMFFSSSFHNAYLEVWYNTGFLGLICYIAAQGVFLYQAVWLFFTRKDPEIKPVLAVAVGYMIGFIGVSMFESIGAGASGINLIFYLFLGFMVSNKAALRSTSPPLRPYGVDLSQMPEGVRT
jgi:O-antigen ligase